MPEITYLITIGSLLIYSSYSLYHRSYFTLLHTLYTIALILYNSRRNQSHIKFIYYRPPLQNKNEDEIKMWCIICKRCKPPRYYHCRICGICIYQMDHHCNWLSCCVGQFNLKIYLHLLINLTALGVFAMVQVLLDDKSWLSSSKIPRFIPCGFLLWQTLFRLLSCYQSITQNQTLIETYKLVQGPNKSLILKLAQVFGCSPNLNWFLPTYANPSQCNIWQVTTPCLKNEPEQLTYADEYLYGQDQDQEHKND